jgi:hypothetical protein
MKWSIAIVAALLMFGAPAPSIAGETAAIPQARSNTGGVAPGETSDRTPELRAQTPAAQINKTADGETSDRTPANHGEVRPARVMVTN